MKRHEGLILRDITVTYGHLHPDSLEMDCDGDRKAMARRSSRPCLLNGGAFGSCQSHASST